MFVNNIPILLCAFLGIYTICTLDCIIFEPSTCLFKMVTHKLRERQQTQHTLHD